jgi:hypothetical protein
MKTILAAAVTAVTVASLSFGAFAATSVTVTTKPAMKPAVVVVHKHHPHKVCKTVWHHHKKTTVCAWVK